MKYDTRQIGIKSPDGLLVEKCKMTLDELTDGQYWAIIVLLLIFNIVMSSWIISNDYKNDL